jgi:hypothetical protein
MKFRRSRLPRLFYLDRNPIVKPPPDRIQGLK